MSEQKQKVSIVFVCTGNTCRSPMAEFMFKDYLKQKKRSSDFSVTSAGLEAGAKDFMTAQAHEALTTLGIKHNPDRRARVFTVRMSLDSDLIIGMTDEHAMRCDSDNAISFVSLVGHPIRDPFGYGVEVYLDCCAQMRAAFDAILEIADEKLAAKRAEE